MTMKNIRLLLKFGFFTLTLLVLGILTYRVAVTQVNNPGNFPETGHTITGEFLDFYQQIPNPELIYGYPITERMTSKDGLIVQYFQRARFELHPEAPAGQQVQLTPLGGQMYKAFESGVPFPYTKNPSICRPFETGFDVCYSFLGFFDQQGGVAQFGAPISDVEERGGRLVQYFENARMEWYPDSVEAGLTQEVQLTFLGRQYFDLLGEDPVWLIPVGGSFGQEIISLQAHAFPVQAVVSAGENQALYVIVQDQNLTPVKEVNISLRITYPTGTTLSMTLPLTNEFGYTSADIPFAPEGDGVGSVNIEVTAVNAAFSTTTRASFRISP